MKGSFREFTVYLTQFKSYKCIALAANIQKMFYKLDQPRPGQGFCIFNIVGGRLQRKGAGGNDLAG